MCWRRRCACIARIRSVSTGCPTGAIGRFPGGQIDIEPKICIGCGDCATQCPYNAISMVPRKRTAVVPPMGRRLLSWFDLSPPEPPRAVTETEDLLAVKCNLCNNTPLNPAGKKARAFSCQENCPTSALVRVNPREYFDGAKSAVGFIYQDQTHAIGRNIHRSDPLATAFHVLGILALLALTSGDYLGGENLYPRWTVGAYMGHSALDHRHRRARRHRYRYELIPRASRCIVTVPAPCVTGSWSMCMWESSLASCCSCMAAAVQAV